MGDLRPSLSSVYIFVRDMDASIAFYRSLGVEWETFMDGAFARAKMPDGSAGLELGTAALTRRYDAEWREPSGPGTNTLNFNLPSAADVDALYGRMVAAGHRAHLAPFDAFWGSRFAILDDPDGNVVGLHGPRG